MSIIRTAAIGAVVVLGLALQAGAQTPAPRDTSRREMLEGQVRRQMEGRRRGMKRFGHGQMNRRGGERRLIADLNLTDAQKTRVRAIQDKYQSQFRSLRDQQRAQFRALQDARQKGDTSAATRQRFAQLREQFQQRALTIRQQQQGEIRSVLTAEQRAKWDAAAAERKQRVEGRRGRMKSRGELRRKA